MKTNRAVIVQCRLSSTRLPGKALMELGGKSVLSWVLRSMHKVPADRYFVATDEASYDSLEKVCEENDFECFSGDLNDVLKRFCDLIKTLDVSTIVRATADNPFLFYEAAVESVEYFEKIQKSGLQCDYFTYSGLPHGSGVEIFSAKSLLKAATETQDPYDHEHVGPALYNHKEKYRCEFLKAPNRFNFPQLRTTIDTYSDYLRAISIVNHLESDYGTEEPYTTEQILEAVNSKAVTNPVIFIPSVVKGQGTGHLHRCLNAVLNKNYFVYIPEDYSLNETDNILKEYFEKGLKKSQIINQLPDETYVPVYVIDTFQLTKELAGKIRNNKLLISIDEGSTLSACSDYLLDIIPSVNLKRIANYSDSAFITKPTNIRNSEKVSPSHAHKVLVCLGGEDPAGLTVPAVNAVRKCLDQAKITAVISMATDPYVDYKDDENIEFVKPIQNLREKLYEYDIVITHYGLTAFEAAYAGCGVILLSTTDLHKKLAQKYSFAFIEGEITQQSMLEALNNENLYPQLQLNSDNSSLGDYIGKLSSGKKMFCPVCGKQPVFPDEIVSRNKTRTYRRCQDCKIVYMSYSNEQDKSYQKSYFFEDYKKQYGKTYQEDFDAIKAQGIRRLEVIKSIDNKIEGKNLFDIGCAYGPFLSAASSFKLNSFGTDISEDAVKYVRNELHFPANYSSFPDTNVVEAFGLFQFDIVTMWYVIEHFKDLDSVLRKVNSILKTGGIFAFSTPSGEGISARSNTHNFYQISPTDHYTIWEPSKASAVLKKYGFDIVRVVSTGHHPERFPFIKNNDVKPESLCWKLTMQMSKMRKLGDTVEIYCIKRK